VGRAGVPGPDAKAGRARVPAQAGASGRATVGRASVGAGSQKSGSGASLGADVIENRGPAQRPPKGAKPSAAAAARAKRARRRNWILGSFALLIMIAGGTVVGGAFFYDTVALPQDLPQRDQATTIFYADNKTQMAKIGDQNRTIIPSDQIPQDVKNAAVATENKDFYQDQGISYTGIMRAAWNNMTGGQRQGASTITQQYARDVADLKGITYSRKLREAVLAMKLNKTYSKDQILTAYLNSVYFGRESYGIEAAAEAYFSKHAKELNVAEGMALSAMIRNPAGGPNGLSFYDGTVNPQAALDRFDNYIKPNMVQMKFLTAAQVAELKYPTMKKYDPKDPAFQAQWGLDKATGNVIHNVMDELYHLKDAKGNPVFPNLKTGGYRIVTTIDKGMQDAAEKYTDSTNKDSPLYKQPNAVAAMVSVEPYTGRVRAYYGGPNGGDKDLAGVWRDPVLTKCGPDEGKCDLDRLQGFGRHRAASSFKIYTLGAALKDGISLDTYWDGTSPKNFPDRKTAVVNAEGKTACAGGDKHCTLLEATAESLNVPFYSLTRSIGADKVLDFAKQAGIRYIWNLDVEPPKRSDLATETPQFSPELGIGAYAVTVLDHANGVATMAARGARAPVHFVSKVYKGAATVHSESFKATQIPGFKQEMADDESFALQKVLDQGTGKGLQIKGRAAAAKTGTWQAASSSTDIKNNGNSNAWMVGYVAPDLSKKPQFYGLATAVWVGAKEGDSAAVKINGSPLFGSTGPGPIWKKYMDVATANMPSTKFPAQKGTGDDGRGDSQRPAPTPSVDPNAGQPGGLTCPIPVLCPSGQQGQPGDQAGGRPGNGNGNGNGGQGGGSPLPGTPAIFPSRRN
jgi:membrane peptidoglycan carboxypeptidase